MVKKMHHAGIEVILDVVYNHSAEGNHLGPLLSFKGLDNRCYYHLDPANPRHYARFHGHWQHVEHGERAVPSNDDGPAFATGCRTCMSTVFASISRPLWLAVCIRSIGSPLFSTSFTRTLSSIR